MFGTKYSGTEDAIRWGQCIYVCSYWEMFNCSRLLKWFLLRCSLYLMVYALCIIHNPLHGVHSKHQNISLFCKNQRVYLSADCKLNLWFLSFMKVKHVKWIPFPILTIEMICLTIVNNRTCSGRDACNMNTSLNITIWAKYQPIFIVVWNN